MLIQPKTIIKAAIWGHPTIFKTKADVLRHMFFVIGNGWDWHEGNLVDFGFPLEEPTPEELRKRCCESLDKFREFEESLHKDWAGEREPLPPIDYSPPTEEALNSLELGPAQRKLVRIRAC